MAKQDAVIELRATDNSAPAFASFQRRMESLTSPIQALQSKMGALGMGREFDGVATRLNGLRGQLAAFPVASTLIAGGAIAAGVAGLIRISTAAHDALGALQDLSEKNKVGTGALQVLKELGADSGVAVEASAKAFSKLNKNIAEAMGGSKEAIQSFADVGIDTKDLSGGVESVFKKIADLYKNKDFEGADPFKIQSAMALMGKSGAELIPILEKGGAGFEAAMAKLKKEGRFFEADQIQAADAVGDAWGGAMRRLEGLKTSAGLAMSPMLTAITDSINKMMDSGARGDILAKFKQLGETIAQVAPRFIESLPSMIEGVAKLAGAIAKLGAFAGWDKLILGGMALLAAPFIVAAGTMAATVATLSLSFLKLSASMTFLAATKVLAPLASMQVALASIGFTATASWAAVLAPVVIVGAAIAGLAYLIYDNWGGIKAFLGGMWDGFTAGLAPIKTAFQPVIDLVGEGFAWFTKLFGITNQSAQSFSSWAVAGDVAGQLIAAAFKGLLIPITAVFDVLKLVGALWTGISGGGFKMPELSTAQLFKDAPKPPVVSQISQNQVLQGQSGAVFNAQSPQYTPFTAANLPPIASQRSDVGGRLDVRILSDGRAQVDRVESNNSLFNIDVNAGQMFSLGA